jgi:hypothetical protein
MRLTDETLASLEAAASKQIGREFGTTVGVMPGQLRELLRGYRISTEKEEFPLFMLDTTSGDTTLVSTAVDV